jgi:hypothetical protein
MKMRTYLNWVAIMMVSVALFAAPTPAAAQASGSGKPAPNMKGPAPRLNGKPSFAGIWATTRRADVTNKSIPGFVPELPYTEWGKKQFADYDPNKNGDYAGSCLPFGFSRSIYGPHPTQIIQDENYVVFLFEQNSMFYNVPIDGRGFTPDLPPSWFGESIGHWDGDTLVVETRNMNGYAKIDTIGHPYSKEAKFTQTFKRVNFGTIEHTFTVDDPKTYTKPWTIHDTWEMDQWGLVLMEYACMESNLETLFNGGVTPWKPPVDDQE